MELELSDDAIEYGRVARRAFDAAGGDALVVEAEANPQLRTSIEALLDDLGARDLDVRDSPSELEAAAALCRSAGYFAIPYPVAERLCRIQGMDGMVVVEDRRPQAPAEGLDWVWTAVGLGGSRFRAQAAGSGSTTPKTSPFVVDLDLEPMDRVDPLELALGVVLPCWTLLGFLDRAVELTRSHVKERHQFGAPLASLQGVQFELTEAEVERVGLEVLANHALWSLQTGRTAAFQDALGLRSAALEAAEAVFRVAHLLHGASGFCDESTLSWLSRHSRTIRRLPMGLSQTRAVLARQLGTSPLEGIFAHPGDR